MSCCSLDHLDRFVPLVSFVLDNFKKHIQDVSRDGFMIRWSTGGDGVPPSTGGDGVPTETFTRLLWLMERARSLEISQG